ncbi:hypothetical protein B0J14DRAFT_568300 [Halenospora varia]|nr:hypothetical protein B0J14DRAFT_568300 [Halenospora varia]
MKTAVKELHFNITISILNIPNLIYLQDEAVVATVKTNINHWAYNWVLLAASYGACALINLCAIAIAAVAIWDNSGVGNRTLDTLVGDKGQGDDDMQKEVANTKVKPGTLMGDNERGKRKRYSAPSEMGAFGVEGEVERVRRRRLELTQGTVSLFQPDPVAAKKKFTSRLFCCNISSEGHDGHA